MSIDRLVDLNKQLLVAENERKLAEANYQQAQRPEAAGALGEEVSKGVIVETEIRLADLRAKRAQLLVGATEQWPEVREITQQIAALEANARTVKSGAATTALAGLRTKYQQAQALEAALRADFERQRGRIEVQNQAAVSYRLMQQEVTTKQGLLAEALKRLGENDLAQAEVANNASVLDHALIPNGSDPDGPWRLPFVTAALLFSLLAAIGFVLAREAFNHTLRSGVDVEQALDMPAMGTIRAAPSRQARLFTRGADRVAWNEFAEDYRRLRTSMLLPAQRPGRQDLAGDFEPSPRRQDHHSGEPRQQSGQVRLPGSAGRRRSAPAASAHDLGLRERPRPDDAADRAVAECRRRRPAA